MVFQRKADRPVFFYPNRRCFLGGIDTGQAEAIIQFENHKFKTIPAPAFKTIIEALEFIISGTILFGSKRIVVAEFDGAARC